MSPWNASDVSKMAVQNGREPPIVTKDYFLHIEQSNAK